MNKIESNIPTILIIDDNNENIKVAGSVIRKHGYKILYALNGSDGIEIATLRLPDLILLDIQMPITDGYEVCSLIKKNELTANIPIIFLTGKNDDETIEKIFSIGASDYAKKPFSEVELVARIGLHVKMYHLYKAMIEAENANKAKSDFLSNMSHEMRTPLNSIIGYSELLLEDERDAEKSRTLNTVVSAGKHLLSLINELLNFSKIESGKIEINKETVATLELINKIESMLSIFKKNKNINFNIFFSKNIPEIFEGDRQKIEQILINLIGNAFKFTDNGYISVKFYFEDNNFIAKVSDTGIGIKKENFDKVFDEFNQLEKNITEKYGGTGLGLTISKKLALLMGGDLTFESTYGKGTTFTFAIPIKMLTANELTLVDKWIHSDYEIKDLILEAINKIPEKVNELIKYSNKISKIDYLFLLHKTKGFFGNFHMMEFYNIIEEIEVQYELEVSNQEIIESKFDELKSTVLLIPSKYFEKIDNEKIFRDNKTSLNIAIVDDVEDHRNLVALVLKKYNLNIAFTENGFELLELMKNKTFDLIFLDVQMPVMDGKETIKKIRENKNWNNVKVIALSAQTRMEETNEMLALGCNDYVAKPIDKEKLRNIIIEYIKKKGEQIDYV